MQNLPSRPARIPVNRLMDGGVTKCRTNGTPCRDFGPSPALDGHQILLTPPALQKIVAKRLQEKSERRGRARQAAAQLAVFDARTQHGRPEHRRHHPAELSQTVISEEALPPAPPSKQIAYAHRSAGLHILCTARITSHYYISSTTRRSSSPPGLSPRGTLRTARRGPPPRDLHIPPSHTIS